MEIKAIKFREGGFAVQPFAFGGEEGMDKFDMNIKYRSGLTNYLIDTGDVKNEFWIFIYRFNIFVNAYDSKYNME